MDALSSLHPRLLEPTAIAGIREAWSRSGCLRIDGVLAPGLADELEPALRALPFEPHFESDEHTRCFFWRCIVQVPGADAPPLPPPFDRLARFLGRDLVELASAVSGRAVLGQVKDWITVCRYKKGSYLDAHQDYGVGHAVAYVLGLTRARWPAEAGGHLEFLAGDRETVIERRPPGFDTLDLYDVHPVVRWHRVPLLVEHQDRLTVSGWLPGEGGPLASPP